MKKTFKILSLLIIIGISIVIIYGSYFYFFSDAPITKGVIEYREEYKKDLRLDLYLPTKSVYKKSPVVVFFHGGAWITGAKEALNFNRFKVSINQLRNDGYAIVSPNYTLARKNSPPFPNCIVDAFDALEWIELNSEKYNFDMNNIGVFGESAGAHIALMLAYSGNKFKPDSNARIKINYVIDAYGPSFLEGLFDMPRMDTLDMILEKLPEKIRKKVDLTEKLFGFDPYADSLRTITYMDNYSPINYVNKNAPPTLIIHGSNDRLVPLSQSEILKHSLDSLNVESRFHILKGVDHAFIGINSKQRSDVQKWIVEFVEKHTSVN